MKVYIGAPIDTARPEMSPIAQFEELAQLVRNGLGPDVAIFNPCAAFASSGDAVTGMADMAYFYAVNTYALQKSDIAVFLWNGSPTFGVPLEIQDCSQSKIPSIVLNVTGKRLGVYARLMAKTIVDSPELLVAVLQKFKVDGVLLAKASG